MLVARRGFPSHFLLLTSYLPMSTLSPPVRPDLLQPDDVARLGSLEVLTEGIVEGFLAGMHRSPRRGFSVEFAEHRQYQFGDEPRYVDWKRAVSVVVMRRGSWAAPTAST